MLVKRFLWLFSILLSCFFSTYGQNITALEQQFNGRYDFTFVGNTMNLGENNITPGCEDLLVTSSTATLNLASNQAVIKAYLYWAGSGTGDFDVKLNNVSIIPQRTFSNTALFGLPFFSAVADVTSQVINTGNGAYTLSDLDISETLLNVPGYCQNRTNFAGWAILVIYKDPTLTFNQIKIYDGLQSVPNAITINLDNLNVVNNIGAKIGFIAWEGDANLDIKETLSINNTALSNPPLNPEDNAFNGTNSVTNSNTLYNMDLDIYDIQNNINIGASSAQIKLTSGQDFVLINTIITKLNNQLPDATIALNTIDKSCNSRIITVHYTVYNTNCTSFLPAGTPIALYANGIYIGQTETTTIIPINGNEIGQITLTIPSAMPANFMLKIGVDDKGDGTGIVPELIETNNAFSQSVSLWLSPQFNSLPDINRCVTSIGTQIFDITAYQNLVKVNAIDVVAFFNSYTDALANVNPIIDLVHFTVNAVQTIVYIRLDNQNCFSITSFAINLHEYPSYNPLPNSSNCRTSEITAFDLTVFATLAVTNATDTVHFFTSEQEASSNTNPIVNSTNYQPDTSPKTIFVRIDNGYCYSITSFVLEFLEVPKFKPLPTLLSCNEGFNQATFDFSGYEALVKQNPTDTVTFYETFDKATQAIGPILDPSNFVTAFSPKEIFVRIENKHCYSITSFSLQIKNCPPKVYNFVSANNDMTNDVFFIAGLKNIFLNYTIEIYNRWGVLIWTGHQEDDFWDGTVRNGFLNTNAPDGTYFYILYLNDVDYPEPLKGFLYLNH